MSFETTDSNHLPILTIDPEFKTLIPPLLQEERTGLEQSILNEGCRDALVVWGDYHYNPTCVYTGDYFNTPLVKVQVLIDGHNRYEICKKHGIQFQIIELDFDDRDDVIDWIYQNQLSKRNLTDEKRAYVLGCQYRHRKKRHGGDRKSDDAKSSAQNEHLIKTSEHLAEENNVSRETVKRAEKYADAVDIITSIIDDDITDSIEPGEDTSIKTKILTGEIKASKQDIVKLAEQPIEKQKAVINRVLSGECTTVKEASNKIDLEEAKREAEEAAVKTDVELSIHHGDCVEWLSSLDRCADLLITDPPYATDVDDIETFAQSWLPIALSKVKATGRAYVCIGAYPEELKAYLNVDPGELELCQVLVWTYRNTLGPSPKDQYKLNWQAILYYKGPDAPPLNCPIMTEQFSVQDINAPDNRHGEYERWHAWQKPDELANRLIRHSTNEGDLIIDPFSGTGTFIIAAKKLNRDAIGCDQSRDMIDIAYSRRGVLSEC